MLVNLFKDVVQVVLLFRSEMWVLTPRISQTLGEFQHKVARKIMGKQIRRLPGSGWEYTTLGEVMQEAGLEEVEQYVVRRQNTVAQYITTRLIMDLCEAAVRRPGKRVSKS